MNHVLGADLTAAILALCAVQLGGCANPVNDYTYAQYYHMGMNAEQAGNLVAARIDYGRAQINAQTGNLGPAKEAYACYEWSRVTGYLGGYVDAEKGFKDVLQLIGEANGQAESLRAPTLCEFARLLNDTEQHAKAVPIYEEAVAALDSANAVGRDPMGYASFLNDYAWSLRQAGFADQAFEVSARAVGIEREHKGEAPRFVPRRYRATERVASVKSHAGVAEVLERQGSWSAACWELQEAVRDLETDRREDPLKTVVYYEYGRCLGVIGHYAEAEEYLKKALQRDQAANGPAFMDLTELARLDFDQAKFPEAIGYFEPLMAELDRIEAQGKAPAAYSDILREYAEALRMTGQTAAADAAEGKIAALKAKFPNQHSATDRTPYGRFAPK